MTHILVLGKYLLSFSNIDKTVKLWDYSVGEEVVSFEVPEYYDVTAVMHPDTYLNKVLFATKQGPLYLWNFKYVTIFLNF